MGLLIEHVTLVLRVHSEAVKLKGNGNNMCVCVCVKHGFNSMLPPLAWHPFIDMSKYQHKKHNVSPCIINFSVDINYYVHHSKLGL